MDLKKTTLLVIRHGETVRNIEERFQGHGDSPLTDAGQAQALALADRLTEFHFDTLVSSDLGRAMETASIITEQTGHNIRTDSRLRERNFGDLEGLTFQTIQEEHAQILNQLDTNDPDYVIPNGESLRQHYQRNTGCIEELIEKNHGGTVAMVVHGGVLDSVFRLVTNLPLNAPRCFVTTNARLSIVHYGRFYGTLRWVIDTWGDVAHLNGISRYRGLG